jgi:MFS family permease
MDWLFLAIYFGNLLNYIDRGAISTLLPELQNDFALSKIEQGVLGSTFMIGYIVSCLVFSYLASYYNRQRLLVVGGSIWLTSTLIMATATHTWVLYLARALSGVGEASYQSIVPMLLSDIYGESKGWRRTSVFFTAINIGTSLGVLFGGAIRPWRWIYGVEFIFGLVFIIVLSRCELTVTTSPKKVQYSGEWAKIKTIFSTSEWWYATLGNMALTYATGALSLWMPTFYNDRFGDQINYGNITAALSMALLVSGAIGSILGDRLSKRICGRNFERRDRLMSMCLIATIYTIPLSIISISVNLSFGYSILVFSLALVGFAFLNIPNSMITVVSVPQEVRSYSTSLCILLIHLGGDMPSPIISSAIWEKTHNLREALELSMCSLIVAVVVYLCGYYKIRSRTPLLRADQLYLNEPLSTDGGINI